jgi:hypothetical protein
MRIVKHLTGILATGYMLMFYSELVFWAHVRPADSLSNWIQTWLAYSLLGFVFLSMLIHFHIRSKWALFLAGSVFGWLTEGVIVQTAYESLPLSISFTGLAWHALISVWVGWYAMRRALHTSLRRSLLLTATVGLFYGLWAIAWWIEPDGALTSPIDFAQFAFISTLLLILATWLADRTQAPAWTPSRPVEIIVAALFVLYFIFITVPAAPLALIILPLLLAIVYFALRRSKRFETQEELFSVSSVSVPLGRYLCLLLIPASAAAFYTAAYALSLRWQTNWLVYLVTTPLGFILFGVSLVKVWRQSGPGLEKIE